MTRKTGFLAALLATASLVPLIAAADGVAMVWPATHAGDPTPAMPGVPRQLRDTLANFDDLDFRVYSGQQWQDVHLSHADNVVVHWPNGRITTGLAQHVEDMKWMFTFAPDTRIVEHPVRFGANDAEWTAVMSYLDGTFTQTKYNFDGTSNAPTGNTFHVPMVTLGHWNAAGLMDEEYLFWDNAELNRQLGI